MYGDEMPKPPKTYPDRIKEFHPSDLEYAIQWLKTYINDGFGRNLAKVEYDPNRDCWELFDSDGHAITLIDPELMYRLVTVLGRRL